VILIDCFLGENLLTDKVLPNSEEYYFKQKNSFCRPWTLDQEYLWWKNLPTPALIFF